MSIKPGKKTFSQKLFAAQGKCHICFGPQHQDDCPPSRYRVHGALWAFNSTVYVYSDGSWMQPIDRAHSEDLFAARTAYFEQGGVESDIGPRDNSSWYWRRTVKLLKGQRDALQKRGTDLVLRVQERDRLRAEVERLRDGVDTQQRRNVELVERVNVWKRRANAKRAEYINGLGDDVAQLRAEVERLHSNAVTLCEKWETQKYQQSSDAVEAHRAGLLTCAGELRKLLDEELEPASPLDNIPPGLTIGQAISAATERPALLADNASLKSALQTSEAVSRDKTAEADQLRTKLARFVEIGEALLALCEKWEAEKYDYGDVDHVENVLHDCARELRALLGDKGET